MILTVKAIKALIKKCQLQVEQAYQAQLEEDFGGDEYFKRGFLLATNEISNLMINVLSQYEIRTNETK
jgi:hypothetical protein